MPPGWSALTVDANTSSSWPLTTSKAADRPRCVTGMPASAGAATALVTPGTMSNGTPAALQRQRLLAAAPEHERVAALQPHDAAAALRGANHHGVDVVLRQRVTAGALADEEPLGAPRQTQHAFVDQRVVQHQIRRAQARHGLAASAVRDRPGPAPTSETWPIIASCSSR